MTAEGREQCIGAPVSVLPESGVRRTPRALAPAASAQERHRPGGADVIVLDAEERQALVVARSLGLAGLRVGLVKGANAGPGRLSAPSRFSRRVAWCYDSRADFSADPDSYAREVRRLAEANRGCVIVPCSDQSLAALRPFREQLQGYARLAMAAESALEFAVDKHRTLALASEMSIPIAPSVLVESPDQADEVTTRCSYPVVVKPTRSWTREGAGERLIPREAGSRTQASALIAASLERGVPCLVQPWLEGTRESVLLFRAEGRTVAALAMATLRMSPILGGASVVRETIPLDPVLLGHAEALVAGMGLEGYAGVEFRRDSRGVPCLMEVNPRLEGSLEVPLRAGIDFADLTWRWAAGRPLPAVGDYRVGVRMRWLTGDLRWLFENLRSPDQSDAVGAPAALATFLGGFAVRQAYDCADWRDPAPLVAEAGRLIERCVRRLERA